MVDLGLNERDLGLIRGVLAGAPGLGEAIVYGSRAKGTHRPESDVDLALVGIDDALQVAEVAAQLDELPMPYRFDVQPLSGITHPPLREHIARVGLRIYPA